MDHPHEGQGQGQGQGQGGSYPGSVLSAGGSVLADADRYPFAAEQSSIAFLAVVSTVLGDTLYLSG
jgi:hypothetical protein